MNPLVKAFGCLLLIAAFPMVALAQTTETDSETITQTPAEPEAPVPGADLAVGAPENADGIGQTYVKESHGDWDIRCIRTEDGNDPCQLYQLLLDSNDTSVAEINIFTVTGNPNIVGGATIVTPLETLLTADLRMGVDAGEVRVYPFAFCRQIGCFSRLGLTAADIADFQRGSEAKVVIVPAAAPDQTVDLRASLSGFTAGWNAMLALSEAQIGNQ